MFRLGAELPQREQRLLLVTRESSPLRHAIAITGLGQTVPTYPTRAAALERR